MIPWQAGGEMISAVSFSNTTFNDIPFKFEAGTPNISGAIGLATALTWLSRQDRVQLELQETTLLELALLKAVQILKAGNALARLQKRLAFSPLL